MKEYPRDIGIIKFGDLFTIPHIFKPRSLWAWLVRLPKTPRVFICKTPIPSLNKMMKYEEVES